MLTMSDYTTVLTTLQQIAPEAHIAGGAVRDTILQKQIHDVDVFMKDEHVEEAAALLRSSCSYVKVGEWKQYLEFSDPAMTRVAKVEKADETIPICIIGLLPSFANPKDNIARFDFYPPAETLTHARMLRVRARLPYPIGPPDVFAMAVSVGARAA